jgi:L-ribulose-5-phosphate 3-epimerase
MNRRCALKLSALLAASRFAPLLAEDTASGKRAFKIGACDWSLGKMADPGAFALAHDIGLDGVQVSLGTAKNGMALRLPEVQKKYTDAAAQHGVAIASLAIGELNNVPFKSDPQTVEWVRWGIETAAALKLRVILLAFFGKDDLKNDKAGTDETVKRLKELAPLAERAGVILGIESWLNAAEHLAILERVGSKNVQVYYDVANSEKMGYDIYAEIRTLGAERICEFHMKENGSLLGKGRVDFRKVREAIDAIGYKGWMQIEGAMEKEKSIRECYSENCAFLRRTFA